MEKEIWKPIAQSLYYCGIKPIYEVSNTGMIRNVKTKRVLKLTPYRGNTNRLMVQLRDSYGIGITLLASHVIYETFIDKCYEAHVKFKDNNPSNLTINNLYI